MLNIISLGAGVQSTTVALLAARGLVDPMPDCAIFADTGEEPAAVYRHLTWLREPGRLPFPIHVCSAWEGYGRPNIKAALGNELLAAALGNELLAAALGNELLAAALGNDKPASKGTTSRGFHSRPPFFTLGADGSRGMIQRQCTGDYKLEVIEKKVRELLGLRKRQRWPGRNMVTQWIGISTDEATRAKPIMVRRAKTKARPAGLHPHPTIAARWPLLDLGMSRMDCLAWLRRNGYPEPPKSACTFCPFHSNAEWRGLRDHDPSGWSRAVQIDESIRRGLTSKNLTGSLFLHPQRVPLAQADLSESDGERQIDLFQNDCTGTCGV